MGISEMGVLERKRQMAQYFDYLVNYEKEFETLTNIAELKKRIENFRKNILEDPDTIVMWSRKIAELVLKGWLKKEKILLVNKFVDNIQIAYDKKLISKAIEINLNAIRLKGNNSVHEGKIISIKESQDCLIKLDEFLRYYAFKNIDSKIIADVKIDEQIHISESKELMIEIHELVTDAPNKTEISDLVEQSENVIEELVEKSGDFETAMKMLKSIDDMKDKINAMSASPHKDQVEAAIEETLANCTKMDNIVQITIDEEKKAKESLIQKKERIEEILSESDWINHVLNGKGNATETQMKAIKNERSIVQLRGAAGSGKTLCLLAKAVQVASGSTIDRQQNLFNTKKKSLVISYNKTLKKHLNNIISEIPESNNIAVESFDSFINQLARKNRLQGSIHYDNYEKKFIQSAIQELGRTTKDNRFYNYTDKNILNFLAEEFNFLEAKEEMSAMIYYEIARVGRGNKYNISRNSEDRKAIYAIFEKYRENLKKEGKYTLYDAVKYLLSFKNLDQYDYIGIDEAQDLSLISIRLLKQMLNGQPSDGKISQLFIVADENQKMFKSDFRWKYLGERITTANVETLEYNMRNTEEIAKFAGRLINDDTPNETKYTIQDNNSVQVLKSNFSEIQADFRQIYKEGSTLVVLKYKSDRTNFKSFLEQSRIPCQEVTKDDFKGIEPGIVYLSNEFNIKGLEFDHVIMPSFNEDYSYTGDQGEKELIYVAFSRARRLLRIHYQNRPHQLLREIYSEYINLDINLE